MSRHKMSRYDKFTTEELLIIRWTLYIATDNNIAKSLYDSINEYLKEMKK